MSSVRQFGDPTKSAQQLTLFDPVDMEPYAQREVFGFRREHERTVGNCLSLTGRTGGPAYNAPLHNKNPSSHASLDLPDSSTSIHESAPSIGS